uniref:NADH-ubiquinone oxidoreductase chain 5 n=1 Tax=Eurygaster testudinaria TaxID=1134731 RepID=A0A4D6X843_9HEMI|nr:NADH dehydrogenase subunit 5 [Eurygaster testudinaria]QCI09345.1 NADH dehydrogenase subunit 5 [Eurygaster testudinaria]
MMCKYKFWFLIVFVLGLCHFILGVYLLFSNLVYFLDWEVLSINSVNVVMTFLIDWMSMVFMGCVLFISSMVIYYSAVYMYSDLYKVRFLYMVLLFVLSMVLLIVSPNLISILLGWDGLGLVSYCLVIYFQNYKSYSAGMVTVLTNRIGDVAILITIAWFMNFGSWNYIYFLWYGGDWVLYVMLLLVLAAFTKSAQIPFSSWLPAAMAAPTPVSALVHSSTLVTAGVYLLIRFSDLILSYDISIFLLISCLTMFMSGLGANFEYDLKKIIALSTLSQLGLMMSSLFMGFPMLAFFHLLSHAFFKALLFLCAGIMIHCMSDSQDIRHMGYMINHLPYTCACFCISNLSLCGIPFLAGFYSKDLVLEYLTMGYFNLFIYIIYFVSVGLTACYTFRLVYYCISGNSGLFAFQGLFEDTIMMISMIFLTLMAIVCGSLLSWLLFPYPNLLLFPIECKLMPLLFVLGGAWLGYEFSCLYISDSLLGHMFNFIVSFMGSMWFMPYFSTLLMYSNFLILSKTYNNFMDSGWGEFIVSKSLVSYSNYLSSYLSKYQFNSIKLFLVSFLFVGLFLSLL